MPGSANDDSIEFVRYLDAELKVWAWIRRMRSDVYCKAAQQHTKPWTPTIVFEGKTGDRETAARLARFLAITP